jgi:hypothetical protein
MQINRQNRMAKRGAMNTNTPNSRRKALLAVPLIVNKTLGFYYIMKWGGSAIDLSYYSPISELYL